MCFVFLFDVVLRVLLSGLCFGQNRLFVCLEGLFEIGAAGWRGKVRGGYDHDAGGYHERGVLILFEGTLLAVVGPTDDSVLYIKRCVTS